MMFTKVSISAGKEHQAYKPLQKKSIALSLPAVPALQKKENGTALPGNLRSAIITGNVVQRANFEDFDTYNEAKDHNIYSRALLDTQKDDKIEKHFMKGFDANQQKEIFKANKASYGTEDIISDSDGTSRLQE